MAVTCCGGVYWFALILALCSNSVQAQTTDELPIYIGASVGGVVACALALTIFCFCCCCCWRRRRRRRGEMELGVAKPASSEYKIQRTHTE